MSSASEDLPLRTLVRDGSRFSWAVPPGWEQGRGAFGGLTLATMVDALEQLAPDDQPLRSLTATLAGPVPAETVSIETRLLRQGSNTTVIEGQLLGSEGLCNHAVCTFGRDRASDADWTDREPPDMGVSWRERDPAPTSPKAPRFTQHFDFFPVAGFPFSGQRGEATGWVRAKDRPRKPTRGDFAFLIDVWWGGAIVGFTKPRPVGTICFSMQFYQGWDDLDPDAPLFFRGTTPICRGGYALELRELWSEDGRPLATNQQTFVIIK